VITQYNMLLVLFQPLTFTYSNNLCIVESQKTSLPWWQICIP